MISVTEYRFPHLKPVALISGGLAAILFVTFWMSSNVLWKGIFRLASFICFAATVFFGLKLREGTLTLTIQASDDVFKIVYEKEKKTVLEEDQKKDMIIYVEPGLNNAFLSLYPSYSFKIKFRDSERLLPFFKYGGRSPSLDEANATKLIRFLKEHGIRVDSRES